MMCHQNDPRLCKAIQRFGCRFRCLQAIAEISLGRALDAQDILEAYEGLHQDPHVMHANCRCGSQEHRIINDAFLRLGSTKTGRQIGSMQQGGARGWDGRSIAFDFMILHWHTHTADGHFTLANQYGHEIFDPWCHCLGRGLEKLSIKRQLLYGIKEGKA